MIDNYQSVNRLPKIDKKKAISLLIIEFGNGFFYEIVSIC